MTDQSYVTVTETPGSGATEEQLSMMHTRYRVAADLAEGKDVLEVACGAGIGLGCLARKARRVIAGDYDPKLVEIARRHYGERVEIRRMDAQDLPFDKGTFDVVLLLEAIYYLPEPDRFIAEARRVLKDDGILLTCSANKEWPGFNPSPFSYRYFSAGELRELLSGGGFNAQVFAAFPVGNNRMMGRVFFAIRRVAVRFHLIPKTMRGKGVLKRLVYGKLSGLPAELIDNGGRECPLVCVPHSQPTSNYKVIYAIGHLTSR